MTDTADAVVIGTGLAGPPHAARRVATRTSRRGRMARGGHAGHLTAHFDPEGLASFFARIDA